MTPVLIGTEITVVDELPAVAAPTATDHLFLIHTAADTVVTVRSAADARTAFAGETELVALTDAFFGEGGARLTAVPLAAGGDGSAQLLAALALVPADLGPGQVIAPEITVAAQMAALADWAYATNRIYIPDGPAGSTDAALTTLAAALAGSGGARFTAPEADRLVIPGLASGTTRTVPASVVKAALIARNDIATGNPNLAAAGLTNARCRYVLGIVNERGQTARDDLAEAGVNAFRTLYGQAIVPYGYRTVAGASLPLWWDLSGSRTVMAVRAREAAVAERVQFGQIDAEGGFLAAYQTSLAAELKELQRLGALFGTGTVPGYRVEAGFAVNPRADLAAGRVRARIRLKTSPFAEHLDIAITRRPITAEEV